MYPKSLMTLYTEGSIISDELRAMMIDYAVDVGFDEELEEYSNRKHFLFHGGDTQ